MALWSTTSVNPRSIFREHFLVEKTISYSNLADIRSRVAALHGSVNTETTTIAHHANPLRTNH